MWNSKQVLAGTILVALFSSPLYASDARLTGLGGASVTGASGAISGLENPALLMQQKRDGDKVNFSMGISATLRDTNSVIDELFDNSDLVTDLENEIDVLAAQTLSCDLTATAQDVCLTGTETLAKLSGDVLDFFNTADNQPIEGNAKGIFGFSVPSFKIPFSIAILTSATATSLTDISDGDKSYASDLRDTLVDNALTLAEITDTAPLTLNAATNTVDIDLPDNVLTSETTAQAAVRVQLAASFAFSRKIGLHDFDFGLTPKFSTITVGNAEAILRDLDNSDDLLDDIENNEVSGSTFTVDLGVSNSSLLPQNFSLGAVVRNLLKESVSSGTGLKFETTPQLVIGAMYSGSIFTVHTNLALNEAKTDNLDSQQIAVGAEVGNRLFSFRAGLQHDRSIKGDPTSISIGAGLGFLDIGARFNGASSGQLAANISFGF